MSVVPLETLKPDTTLATLDRRLEQITGQLAYLVERQRALDEIVGEIMPLARVAMDGAVETLGTLESAGYFAFAREIRRVLDRVVSSYSAEDVRRLGDQVVGILDTVRNLTQPDMLAMMNEVAGAVHDSDDADPKGMWGLMRAGKDPEVKKGIGVMVAVLKQVGRAADKIAKVPTERPLVRIAAYAGKEGEGPPSWVRHLAPRRARAQPLPASQPAATSLASGAACATTSPPKPAFVGQPALPAGYGPDGFLKDPSLWTRELASELATLIPLTLTDAHWQVIEWARAEHADTEASPNIRRLSVGAGVSIRDLYALFPGKPGVLVAMLAGIPKPGGCL